MSRSASFLAAGRSVRAAAAELGVVRNTPRRLGRAGSPGELLVHDGTGHRASILGLAQGLPTGAVDAGCTDAAVLNRELRARGFRGLTSAASTP
jgi:hypothetical protein